MIWLISLNCTLHITEKHEEKPELQSVTKICAKVKNDIFKNPLAPQSMFFFCFEACLSTENHASVTTLIVGEGGILAKIFCH